LLNERRVSVTTVLGTACGLASWAICSKGMGLEVQWHQGILIVLTNALMGFTIGISSLRYHWMTHGALIGLLSAGGSWCAIDGLLGHVRQRRAGAHWPLTLLLAVMAVAAVTWDAYAIMAAARLVGQPPGVPLAVFVLGLGVVGWMVGQTARAVRARAA